MRPWRQKASYNRLLSLLYLERAIHNMMDFTYSEEQCMMRELAKKFAENQVAPLSEQIDKEGAFPRDLFDQMAKIGFTGLCTPEEYGGSGCTDLEKMVVVEELAKKDATVAATLSIHLVFAALVLKHGSEKQKHQYLPKVGLGGSLGAFALTEPGAGSDAGSVRTTAMYDPSSNEYVLNGTKCFITGGGQADYIAVMALTQPEKKLKGMSCLIIEKGMPGFQVGKIEDKMGLRGSETAELVFDNCRVPAECLLGKEGEGFKYAMIALDSARIGVAAQAVGIAEGAIEQAVKYMHERVQFGKPLAANQGLQWYIADMATKTEAAKWLTAYAAYLKASGKPHTKEAAMAKLFASENARYVTNLALQIHGGYGYMKDYPLERMYRDAKITELYEGTSEIHKVVISRAVLS